MGIDMPAAVVEPQFTALDFGWLRLAGPVALQALGLGLGDVDDRPMLGRHEIGGLHHPFVETSERFEGLEVAGLDKSEVMGSDAVDIVHDDPLVLADAFPNVRSLATAVLGVYLLSMIVVEMVDLVGNHVLDAARTLLSHIGHEVTSIRHRTDVGVKCLDFLVGILKELLRFRIQGGEILIGITVVQFRTSAWLLADGEIHHRLIDGGVPDGLRRPGTSYLAEFLGEEFVDANLMVRPMNQVVGSHEHQSAVVAPVVLLRPLPLGGAQPFLLAEHVQVGHGNIELSVGSAVDVRVANTALLGDGVASDDRSVAVDRRKRVAIVADGHEQRVRGVVEISEKVGTHVLLRRLFLFFSLSGCCPCGK